MQNYNQYVELQTVTYHSDEVTSAEYTQGLINFLNEFVAKYPLEDVMELGCGNGTALRWLLTQKPKSLRGMDLNAEKMKMCPLEAEFFQGDMHDIPKDLEGVPSIIISSHALEHAYDPIKVLSEVHRTLKEEGMFIFVVPYPDQGPDGAHPGKYLLKTDVESITMLGNHGILEVVEKAGFDIVECKTSSIREPEIWVAARKVKQEG